MLCYIAGPLTHGSETHNIKAAAKVGHRLMRQGFDVLIPHAYALTEMLDDGPPASYDEWLARCLRLIKRCDCVLRIPGHSPGADREVEFAREHGIPVFFDEHDLRVATRPPSVTGNPSCKHTNMIPYAGWRYCHDCRRLITTKG